jgi:UDP-N-acetylmuramate dehydrogenase
MPAPAVHLSDLAPLQERFAGRLLAGVDLARYTSARIGGPADVLLDIRSRDELADAVRLLWSQDIPYLILGGGSNILVSDRGLRGVALVNNARQSHFDEQSEPPTLWAESGANLGLQARQAAHKGFAGLEWAAGIPGTLGGAVVGNAGAHGGDMAGNLIMAEILHLQDGEALRSEWPVENLEFSYRSSILKRTKRAVVLSALLHLERSTRPAVQAEIDRYVEHRRRTQPPGASMGSMFKNPPGDFAGRLIDAAGLKGARRGAAEISSLHGNFFVNLGGASASDVKALLDLARSTVAEKFGVELELEVELVGEWED